MFWNYVKSKTTTKSAIGELYSNDDTNEKCTNDQDKAEILSDYFNRVFVVEPDGDIPKVEPDGNKPKVQINKEIKLDTIEIEEIDIIEVIKNFKKMQVTKSGRISPKSNKRSGSSNFKTLKNNI